MATGLDNTGLEQDAKQESVRTCLKVQVWIFWKFSSFFFFNLFLPWYEWIRVRVSRLKDPPANPGTEGELDNDLAQGGQFSFHNNRWRARWLQVRSREAWSGMRPSPGESGEKSRFFQGFLPSWSLRAESRAGRTTWDPQDQLRVPLGTAHTRGTSLDDGSMLMRVLGLFLIPTLAHDLFQHKASSNQNRHQCSSLFVS